MLFHGLLLWLRTDEPTRGSYVCLFRTMVRKGIKTTQVTILAIADQKKKSYNPVDFSCYMESWVFWVLPIVHTYRDKSGLNDSDIRVVNSLVDTYAMCGCMKSAAIVFGLADAKKSNLVSWTSVISWFAIHRMESKQWIILKVWKTSLWSQIW